MAWLNLDQHISKHGVTDRFRADNSPDRDDTASNQRLDAIADGTRRNIAQPPGNLGAGHPSVLIQQGDDAPVDVIQCVFDSWSPHDRAAIVHKSTCQLPNCQLLYIFVAEM